MRTMYNRAKVLMLLSAFVLVGLILICITYAVHGNEYVMKPVNEHLYSGGVLISGGKITDRNGEVISENTDGQRVYNDSTDIRKALLHTVGDNYGFITTGVQTTYASELVGYNFVTGIFNATVNGGNNLTLTLDAEICARALDALDGSKGAVGVYNYKTGEMICMVSSPTYDIYNKPDDINEDETGKYSGIYLNKFLFGQYVPGSVFKIVTAACAIDNIPDIFSRTFYCTGEYTTASGTVICNDVHGELTFEQAFNHSCNSVFAQLAVELGQEKLTQTVTALGILDCVETDRISTARGKFDLSSASSSDIGWSGIGQYTNMVNPLRMMTIAGAVANNGIANKPYFVKSIKTGTGRTVYAGKTEALEAYFSLTTASSLKQIMRSTVTDYYGEDKFYGLEICAKSGTAEVGGDKKPHSWFVGFSQRDDFPYAFAVVVENGGSGYYVAGSVASDVLSALYEAYNE